MYIGLFVAAPLTADDMLQMEALAKAVAASRNTKYPLRVVEIACPDGTPRMKVLRGKLDGLNLPADLHTDATKLLDSRKVDVVVVVGGLKTKELAGMKGDTAGERIERLIAAGVNVGKDVLVVRSAADPQWQLGDRQKHDWAAYYEIKKFIRCVWAVGGKEPNYQGFFSAVVDRHYTADGSLVNLTPGDVVPLDGGKRK